MNNRILELYSGIGGMHCAWIESGVNGEIVAAVDINNVANDVYKHNFPQTPLLNRNIQSLTVKQIKDMQVNTILMSPPCQPFTRNGKQLDENDPRANSFLYIINIIGKLEEIEYVLLENVKGFESSSACSGFINKLKECNFQFQELLLNPTSVGVPNSRLRYYCIARRKHCAWNFRREKEIMLRLPVNYGQPYLLNAILEKNVPKEFFMHPKLLKRANVLDICYKHSDRSCCFTKAYSHYLEGTGSVYTDASKEEVHKCFHNANLYEVGSDEFVNSLIGLKLRFFTPRELLALMSFPKKYSFPENVTTKQCYRLLGNSLNVKVICELIKILFE